MKARVKATGKIVTVESNFKYPYGFVSSNGNFYEAGQLELVVEESPDYWERLVHQYAGMAMQGILSNPDVNLDYKSDETMPQAVAETVCKIAHALVEKLKKNE